MKNYQFKETVTKDGYTFTKGQKYDVEVQDQGFVGLVIENDAVFFKPEELVGKAEMV